VIQEAEMNRPCTALSLSGGPSLTGKGRGRRSGRLRHLTLSTAIPGVALALALMLGAAPALVPGSGHGEASGLDALLERYVEDAGRTVGAAAAIVTPEGVEMATAGRARGREAPTPSTLFEIGSITKVFTSILLAHLVEEGVVSLETTVGELVPPGLTLAPEVAGITLWELSTHTSGLRMLPGGTAFLRFVLRPADPYRGTTLQDLLEPLARLGADDLETRGSWAYSNLGPALLGRLLQEAAGEPYEALLRERVLLPLGLGETGFASALPEGMPMAQGHRENHRPTVDWQLDAYEPAGGLHSTLSDLVRFLQAVMAAADGPSDDPLAVPLAGPLAASTQVAWDPGDGSRGMGLGWAMEDPQGERAVWHNGRTGGAYAFVGYLPHLERGVVVLTNTSHHGNPFAMGLLHGEPSVERPSVGWASLLFTLGFVAFAPLGLLSFTRRATHPGEDGRLRVGRIHFLDSLVTASFLLALTWKIGAWQVVPTALWWLGVLAAWAVLWRAGRHWPRLPWLPDGPRARNRLTLLSMGFLTVALAWTLFWV
jgi:serine-type D-Ala-D-Ala carboxypeptidase/endopeptidase